MSDIQLFIEAIVTGSDEEIENKFRIEFLEMEDQQSWRILHHSCCHGRVGLVNLLISNHCDINSRTNEGYQPIHLACMNGHIDIVKLLIDNKCVINPISNFGNQSIHFACMSGHVDIVKILMTKTLDINSFNKWGRKPIHLACMKGHTDIVKILIENNCDINASDNWEYQPIHLACMNTHIDIVKILITNRCDINASDKFGYKPIHFACKSVQISIVKILIANKCDINACNNIDRYQPIHYACENGHINIAKLLIDNKCHINAFSNNGYQPIHLACKNGHIDIVKLLIAKKCDINAFGFWGCQPIHLACQSGHTDIVQILIEQKCDINASHKFCGYQPIHFACEKGHIDIVRILIENKCESFALSRNGEPAVSIARKRGHQQIVEILINANPIESIAEAMDLHYNIGCSHSFCRQSFENETFKKGELIGSGGFGKVYKYQITNTKCEIVIKRTKPICEDTKNIEGNINKYSSRIRHENIVQYFGALLKSGKHCIYMEYIAGGSLKDLIDKSKWIEYSKVIKFSKQILKGLQFLHSQGIIHRDIKPDNMLLDRGKTLKLTDFGLSKSLRIVSNHSTTAKTKSICGTPNYTAPEVLLGESYDFPADIWSFGVSIIHMITGKMPYHMLEYEAVVFIIGTTKKIEYTPCQPISEIMQSFINDLLTPDQSNRPSIEFLIKHAFLKDE